MAAFWKSSFLLCVVVSSGCIAFAQEIENTKSELTGNGRSLQGILGGLLLKKLLLKKKKFLLGKGLLLKAGIILAKLKALGLLKLLTSTGIQQPTDLVAEMDTGKLCNALLDVGKSCEVELVHYPQAKHEVYKMHNVIFVEEKVVEEPSVTYVTAEAMQKEGEVQYVVEKPDGSTAPYHPEAGDHHVKYVIENEDGTYTPYDGSMDDVTVVEEKEIPETHKEHPEGHKEVPEGHKEVIYVTDEGKEIEIPEGSHVEVQELAVDTVLIEKETKHVRYYNEQKSKVDIYSPALLEFKVHCLGLLVEVPAFKKHDTLYVEKITSHAGH